MTTAAQAVYTLLTDGKPRTYRQIAEELGVSYQSVAQAVNRLTAEKLIYVSGKTPTPTGTKPLNVVAALPVPNLVALHRLLAPPPPRPGPTSDPTGKRSRRSAAAIERAEAMLRAYVDDDLTMEQIGARHDLTRERVRQILAAFDPTLVALAKRRRLARTRLRAFVATGTLPVRLECRLCGEGFIGDPHSTFCCNEHREIHLALRYQINPEYHDNFQRTMAHWRLRQDPGDIYAHNVLAGTVGAAPHPNGGGPVGHRWIVEGSQVHEWALAAYRNNWPVFEKFHPDVQAQIRASS